jgi:acyl carrier protein
MDRADVAEAVFQAISSLTGRAVERIARSDDLATDLAIDSLIAVKLLEAIEDRLGTRLPEGCEGSLVGISTVGELVERLSGVFDVGQDDYATNGE